MVHMSHYSRLEKNDYTLHVVSITTHTHDRRKSIGKKKQRKEKKIKERKEKKKRKYEKGKERNEKTRKSRKDKARRGSQEMKIEKTNAILADARN